MGKTATRETLHPAAKPASNPPYAASAKLAPAVWLLCDGLDNASAASTMAGPARSTAAKLLAAATSTGEISNKAPTYKAVVRVYPWARINAALAPTARPPQ